MNKSRMHPVKAGKSMRMSFSEIKKVPEMPNLIEVQTNSYNWFLTDGLKEVFDDISPIADFAGHLSLEFIDFTAQGSDAVTAGIKTLISAGMKMAAGAGATYTDAALNAMKYEFCEFAKQFESFTGIDTSGIRDMASRITSSVSPGENLKNTASVMVDFFQEGYKCFVTKEGNEFTTGLIEGYRSGKYGENMKNMQLATDMITDYFSGKPVLEEIQTGLGQMLEETNQSISDYVSKSLMGK